MNEINFELRDVEAIDLTMGMGIKKVYPPIENLEVTPTKEQQVFNHENSYGYDNITVEPIPDEYIIPDGTLPITENATYDVRSYSRVSASVYPAPNLQDKEITINENGTHNIVADEEYDGLNQVSVTVDAIEDLTEELNTYNTELTEQETTIDGLMEALKNKGIGEPPKYAPSFITFRSCDNDNLDYELANLDTSNLTNMDNFFDVCNKITSYDIRHFNTSNVTKMSYMFRNNSKLTSLDLSSFDTSKVTTMAYMFYGCSGLQHLDIRNFTFDTVNFRNNMFDNIPSDCKIIVKDDAAKEWVLTRRSDLSNVKTVAELEVA